MNLFGAWPVGAPRGERLGGSGTANDSSLVLVSTEELEEYRRLMAKLEGD